MITPLMKSRIGAMSKNRFGTPMTIIEYHSDHSVLVEFQDKYKARTKTKYVHFRDGGVRNPYGTTIHGIGFLGVGKYCDEKGRVLHKQAYRVWKGLFDRCYTDYKPERNYVYDNCIVADEWHNFQNFAQWYDENYYKVDGQMMCIDKDILKKDNQIYSSEFCVFVPQDINKTFTTTKKNRGQYPIGVSKDKYSIRADCNMGKKKTKFLGYFSSTEKAFLAYKDFKESYIKILADKYKTYIPTRLYNAMHLYIVEIDD